ncbi:MAG: hypothetical protein AVDCRST_MAG60-1257, partial [uncultured Nocardioides sp.]
APCRDVWVPPSCRDCGESGKQLESNQLKSAHGGQRRPSRTCSHIGEIRRTPPGCRVGWPIIVAVVPSVDLRRPARALAVAMLV